MLCYMFQITITHRSCPKGQQSHVFTMHKTMTKIEHAVSVHMSLKASVHMSCCYWMNLCCSGYKRTTGTSVKKQCWQYGAARMHVHKRLWQCQCTMAGAEPSTKNVQEEINAKQRKSTCRVSEASPLPQA